MKVVALSRAEAAEMRELMAARREVLERESYRNTRYLETDSRLESEKRFLAERYGFDLECVVLVSDCGSYLVGKGRD